MKYIASLFFCIIGLAVYHRELVIQKLNTHISSFTSTKPVDPAIHMSQHTQQQQTSSFPGLPVVPPQDPSLTQQPNMSIPRAIRRVFLAIEQSEGAGARVRRSIGTPKLRNFSPFLMLDHFSIKPGAGFPDHPHRGQETITYLLKGAVDHEDFAGHKGTIETGDLQFMTAGRGIVHAEMPHQNPDGSENVGLQLWVDLPQKLKNCEPRYRDLRASEIPQVEVDDGKVKIKVISGQSHGVDSVKELAYTPVWLLDVTIKPSGKLQQNLPVGWNAFAYTLDGTVTFGEGKDVQKVDKYHNTVFEQKGDCVVAEVDKDAKEDAHFVIVAGMPLDQKIVQYGPFVVNSQEEVYQAMIDYQTFSNGFERAKNWESEIGKNFGN
jgi:redox-sensitive bicupin YhaK (pirin superfamily)